MDLCIRMLEAGYVVRLGRADPIHHMESPRRDLRRMDYYGRRNDILFAWHNVPMPYFPIHLLGTTLNGFASAFQARRLDKMLEGMACGYIDCFRWRTKRRPVSPEVYRLHRSLKKTGRALLSDVERLLPELDTQLHEFRSPEVAVPDHADTVACLGRSVAGSARSDEPAELPPGKSLDFTSMKLTAGWKRRCSASLAWWTLEPMTVISHLAARRRFAVWKSGEIVAFEPEARHFATLQRSIHEQTKSAVPITLVQKLVGRETKPGMTNLDAVRWTVGDPNDRTNTLLKIDVEGAEEEVLAGGSRW